MANTKANRFEKGTGCYTCRVCSRKTRSTGRGDNENCGLCEECFEIGGLENTFSDGAFYSGQTEESVKAEIETLKAQCIAKGGKL